MAFDISTEDVIEIEPPKKSGTCRFRGKVLFSAGYRALFQNKFHQDRSTLHIIAAVLEKYPEGAYFRLNILFNDVPLVLIDYGKKVYIFLHSELNVQKEAPSQDPEQ